MNRKEMIAKVVAPIEEHAPDFETGIVEEVVEEIINEIEDLVTEAFDHLNDIKNVGDLSSVEDCFDVLKKLKEDLY